MANLYDLLMAQSRGDIEDAPNKQRIGEAPLDLRSALNSADPGQRNTPLPIGDRIGYRKDQVPDMPPMPVEDNSEAMRRAQQDENMKRQREAEEYYFKMRNSQNPPSMPPFQTGYEVDPGMAPMPTEAAYPPGYFDPQPTPLPTNIGYPLTPPPPDMRGGPVQTPPQPPSNELLGQLGSMFQPAGQSIAGSSLGAGLSGSLGSGLPGQSMQGQSGTDPSLDALMKYLSTQRKS